MGDGNLFCCGTFKLRKIGAVRSYILLLSMMVANQPLGILQERDDEEDDEDTPNTRDGIMDHLNSILDANPKERVQVSKAIYAPFCEVEIPRHNVVGTEADTRIEGMSSCQNRNHLRWKSNQEPNWIPTLMPLFLTLGPCDLDNSPCFLSQTTNIPDPIARSR